MSFVATKCIFMLYYQHPHMQTQAAINPQDDQNSRGINPEQMPFQKETSTPAVEDISGLEADERAIAEARKQGHLEEIEHVTADERLVTSLRVKEPMPSETVAEIDPSNAIKKEIELIMQEDLVSIDKKQKKLTGLFTELPQEVQKLLKIAGEKLASEILDMFETGKIDAGQIQEDIKQWLKLIPEVNLPWLEQMATLKKDRIINLYNQLKRDPNYLN